MYNLLSFLRVCAYRKYADYIDGKKPKLNVFGKDKKCNLDVP